MQPLPTVGVSKHDPAREVLRELSLLIRHLTRISGGPDDEPRDGHAAARALRALRGRPDAPERPRRRMGISAPTASRAIDALVELRLVDRLRDPDDRRALRLGLTQAGHARASEREARVAAAFAPALAALSAAEREQLVALLSRLSAELESLTNGL